MERPVRAPVLAEGFAVWAAVIFVGGAVSGWLPTLRLPAPYIGIC
ncbi:MAG: hypothetical protein U0670_08245 [Anaerolineae bacterium]